MRTVFWSHSITYWNILIAGCFMLLAFWFFARNVRQNKGKKLYFFIEFLRLITIGLVAYTLFKPERVRLTKILRDPMIAILSDSSESMTTGDVLAGEGNAITRSEWLTRKNDARFWSPLETKYKITREAFATPPALPTNAPAGDPGTDINKALESALQKFDNLRAVLLLSDGDWNTGLSPVSAATKLRMRNVPVFAISVGCEKYLPDIELQNVVAPSYAMLDEHVSIPFTIQSHLPREVKTTVSLFSASGPVASKDIILPANAQFQDSIILMPRIQGEARYTLRIPAEKDEVFDNNNSRDFTINFRHEKLKVLVVETVPRWEYRYLRNALLRDPGIEARFLLMHPDMDVGAGTGYITSFPGTRDELSSFDVVFLGDVGFEPGKFTEANAEMLKGLIEQQGSGLVFLPGMLGMEKALLSSPLADLIPVVFDESNMTGFGSAMESHLVLTERGRGHRLTMLESDPFRNEALWKNLPGFYWYAPVTRAKTGTDVLAVHSVARHQQTRIPLLVTKQSGNGKVLFMGTDSAWRWRRGVEDTYHYRFWGQVVRWMAHQRHLAHNEGIRFFFTPESPAMGEKIYLHATVFDKTGFPISAGTVKATISKDAFTETIELTPEAGGWGVFTGSFVAREGGTYNITMKCDEADRLVKTQLTIVTAKKEKIGQPARLSVLREIAAITGGKCGSPEELEKIVTDLTVLPEPEPVEERFKLWCHPLWGGLLVLLLAICWSARKLMGLV